MKVYIPLEVWYKLIYLTSKTTDEISGVGLVDIDEDGHFVISRAWIPEGTKSTVGSTTLNPEILAKEIIKVREEGKDIKLWWHTHGNGGVFWSGTDEEAMETINPDEWFVCVVINNKGEHKVRIIGKIQDTKIPVNVDAELEVVYPDFPYEDWNKEFKDNVIEEPKAKVPAKYKPYSGKHHWDEWDDWYEKKYGGNGDTEKDTSAKASSHKGVLIYSGNEVEIIYNDVTITLSAHNVRKADEIIHRVMLGELKESTALKKAKKISPPTFEYVKRELEELEDVEEPIVSD